MQVLLPLEFILMLLEHAGDDLMLNVFVEDFFLDDVFSSAVVTITVNDDEYATFATHYYVYANLEAVFDFAGVNTNRIIAQMLNPTLMGGLHNAETGYFTVAVDVTGSFVIAYMPTLRRLALSPDSQIIHDLADNIPTQFMDVLPIIENGRTLVPIRFVAGALDADIDWTPATEYSPLTVHISVNGETLSFAIGEITPELQALGMDVPARLTNDRTMVPLRFVSEFFGAVVGWNDETRAIEILWTPEI
jgi:hypothetical protein